ncbi:acyl-CoA dehydrogenase [Acidocella aquatica]|uniref:Acyl-[acyl-carrier-protein] dehydrogenase MbtN n=1 Tax=Acidocella aquatica TaxID=1922313 RepID=A0ABQ6A5Z1_9PROT|nr:acyl-CoA dehydrogenase family protein [Acidocella aquatica]GLR67870.1 acyl-CoA dehydrogenase [Acidocella aquatica]
MLKHRPVYNEEHEQFRETVRRFAATHVAPHFARWEEAGIVDRSFWDKGGEAGLLCPQIPEEYGGVGGDFRFNAIVVEELFYAGFTGPGADFSVHSDVCSGYILSVASEEQKQRWLPGMVSGKKVFAIAMTEPGTGSDLQGIRTRAVREGDEYVISGQKTFISNGQHCDAVIVVTRTAVDAGSRGMTLIVVEADRPGFRRGRNLHKLGHLSADTSELFFDEVRVPVGNRIGAEGGAMGILMSELPQERLTIAYQSIASAQKAFDITCAYVKERSAFGKPVGQQQNTRFKLADIKADISVGWAFLDQCLGEHVKGGLTSEAASIAKLWASEMQGRVVDQCLQFFGGYGFMREYEICRLFADARVQRIYGGTSEIMRELIARGL